MPDSGFIHTVRSIAGRENVIFVLEDLWQKKAPKPGNRVLWRVPRGGEPEMVLNTNVYLGATWVSPQGSVRVGGIDGAIWTTAAVPWRRVDFIGALPGSGGSSEGPSTEDGGDDEEDEEDAPTRQVLSVVSGENCVYALEQQSPESDPTEVTGILWRVRLDGAAQRVLEAQAAVSCAWASPQGSIWIASSDGGVWTTAPVSWPRKKKASPTFKEAGDHKGKWHAMVLPKMIGPGYPPNAMAIGGTGDDDVFVGTFKGIFYHWNGAEWSQVAARAESCIFNSFHGRAKGDVYATYNGALLHYDGKIWSNVPCKGAYVRGVCAVGADEVYACSDDGKVLRGSPKGMSVIASKKLAFTGIGHFQGRLILSASARGVWELADGRFKQLKDKVEAGVLFATGNRLCFTATDQSGGPGFLMYDPANSKPWRAFTV